MDIDSILEELRKGLARINGAIAALEGGGDRSGRPGRPPKSAGRKHMSAAARARIAAAKKAWWAKQKSKTRTKKAARKRKSMSPAARKKLSAAMKAR